MVTARAWRATRPAMLIRCRRMVAARAVLWRRPTRMPAARVRLCAMAMQASQALLALDRPRGQWR
jgi:hypothetical protein